MAAPPTRLRPVPLVQPPAPPRASGPLDWLLGGAVALAATAVAGVLALLFAAALAVAAVLALGVVLLALTAARARGAGSRGPALITARWTGCGWDAG